jgi:hypothetical protein
LLCIVIECVPSNEGHKFIGIVENFVLFLEEGDGLFFELLFIVENSFAFEDEEEVGGLDKELAA